MVKSIELFTKDLFFKNKNDIVEAIIGYKSPFSKFREDKVPKTI